MMRLVNLKKSVVFILCEVTVFFELKLFVFLHTRILSEGEEGHRVQ